MPVQLWPENQQAYEIYELLKQFGNITFEAIDRALIRYGIEGNAEVERIKIIDKEFKLVEINRQKAAETKMRAQNGAKRR